MNTEPATVKLFIATGDPQGLRTAEISNWSGKGVAAPRSEFARLIDRDEIKKPGVYILIGTEPTSGDPKAYVGESEVVSKRLKDHKGEEFWVQVVCFVSKDENLTKSHIKYLEGKLIDRLKEVGKATTENNSSGAQLPESDKADMDVFLSRIFQLLPVLGTDLFSMASTGGGHKPKGTLLCQIKGLKASGSRSANGFMVLKDSQAVRKERPSIPEPVKDMRRTLIRRGILARTGNCLTFSKDYEFTSPSLAAAVVHGGTANGLVAWKNDAGVKLKDLESK